MDTPALFAYMATLAALTLSPGPLVAVLAARSANRDRRGAIALALGICTGDVVVILAISAGLGFWLHAHPEVFSSAKIVGVGFLVWMAAGMWNRSAVTLDHPDRRSSTIGSVVAGFAICLSSPQTLMLYMVLLPNVVDVPGIDVQVVTLLVLATLLVLGAVFALVILLSGAVRRLLASPTGTVLGGRCMAATVGLSALWVALA